MRVAALEPHQVQLLAAAVACCRVRGSQQGRPLAGAISSDCPHADPLRYRRIPRNAMLSAMALYSVFRFKFSGLKCNFPQHVSNNRLENVPLGRKS